MSYRFTTLQPLKYYVLKDIRWHLLAVIHLILCISVLPFFYYAVKDEAIYLVLTFELFVNVKNTYVVELVVTFSIDELHWILFYIFTSKPILPEQIQCIYTEMRIIMSSVVINIGIINSKFHKLRYTLYIDYLPELSKLTYGNGTMPVNIIKGLNEAALRVACMCITLPLTVEWE